MEILRQYKLITTQEQIEYFDGIHRDNKQMLFSVDRSDSFVAYCGLVNINYVYSTAEISFVASPTVVGQDYEKLFLFVLGNLFDIGFNQLNLNKLWTETYEFREFHINILEKFGFVKEGVLRDHIFKMGKRHNSIIHSKLRGEHDFK